MIELLEYSLSEFISSVSDFIGRVNPFRGVRFADLYEWLPGDIQAVCGAIIVFSVIMFVIGLIKRMPLM